MLCSVKLTCLQLENIQRKYGIQYISTSPGLCLPAAHLPLPGPFVSLMLDPAQC